MIHGNHVVRVPLDGIVVTAVRGGAVSVNNNVIRGVGFEVGEQRHAPAAEVQMLTAISIGPAEDADVRANQVLGVRSAIAKTVAGVLIEGARNSQVALNTVNDVGALDGRSAFGIEIRWPFDRTNVSENRVRQLRSGSPALYTGVLIAGAARPQAEDRANDFQIVDYKFASIIRTTEHGHYLYGFDRIVHLELGRELGAVRANTIDGAGLRPMVHVSLGGNALVNDNQIVFDPAEGVPAVRIRADSAVVSANYIQTQPRARAVSIDADPDNVAIATNVTNGQLLIRGLPLTPPWDANNVATT
jgi:hypothetical protein